MNQIDYPSSSDDEDQGPKKVVKIIVKEIKNVEYQRTFNPTKKGSLFALLPEPSAKKKTPLGQGGGTQVQIDIQKPIKRKIVEPIEDKIETEESDGDDIDFFTLPNTVEEISPKGKLGKKVLGPARPPQEKVIINNINTPKVQERETYILQGYDNSARGPIYVKTITQSSQMGDSHKKQKIENVSKDIPQVYDDAFKVFDYLQRILKWMLMEVM
jgi:hypothetical protein